MKVLLKQVNIVSPQSPLNGLVKDIYIENGKIEKIADQIDNSDKAVTVIQDTDLHCSIGWMDTNVQWGDPGLEYRETIESGAAAAASGGFTDVLLMPNSQPTISSKSQVEYVKQRTALLPVTVLPIGSITKNAEGKELAEMYDMYNSGAVAFSDGNKPVQASGIMLKAFQYILNLPTLIIQTPNDKSLSGHGLMNEGIQSTRLGLPGIPAIAEELMIARDIELLKYSKSALHISSVSTVRAVELIDAAKKEGLNISCSVTPYHLLYCDEDLHTYDTNLKIEPPLRNKEDMLGLRQALLQGKIDCITSQHKPLHPDEKICEFEYAKAGISGIETVFPICQQLEIPLEKIIDVLAVQPRKILGRNIPLIAEGEPACITLFAPKLEYTITASSLRTISKNNPFIGQSVKGKVIGIINNNQLFLNTTI